MDRTVRVSTVESEKGWRFEVQVAEPGGSTSHRVTLSRATFQRITGGGVPVEEFIRMSFSFLLDREPKSSILGAFDIEVIREYFPEFEETIRRSMNIF